MAWQSQLPRGNYAAAAAQSDEDMARAYYTWGDSMTDLSTQYGSNWSSTTQAKTINTPDYSILNFQGVSSSNTLGFPEEPSEPDCSEISGNSSQGYGPEERRFYHDATIAQVPATAESTNEETASFRGFEYLPNHPTYVVAGMHLSAAVDPFGDARPTYQSPGHFQSMDTWSINDQVGIPTAPSSEHIPVPQYLPQYQAFEHPWSQYSVPDQRINEVPLSDVTLLAPVGTQGIRAATNHVQQPYSQSHAVSKVACPDQHRSNGCRGYPTHPSHATNEDVGSPPSDNPVGPPRNLKLGDHRPKDRSTGTKRRGIRQGPLDPDTARHALVTRTNHACWPCARVKETCRFEGSDPVCLGCRRRASKARGSDQTLCHRTQLADFRNEFLPDILLAPLQVEALEKFHRENIHYLIPNNSISVKMSWGFGADLKVEAQEACPRGEKSLLLHQIQYRLNPRTKVHEAVEVPSPPLAMELLLVDNLRSGLDKYVDCIVREHFARFAKQCFRGDRSEFRRSIMVLLYRHYLDIPVKEQGLVYLCLKLTVITFMMGHASTIAEDSRQYIWERLRQRPERPFGIHTSPMYINKQLKFLLSSLQQDLFGEILLRIQQKLRENTRESWTPAFAAMAVVSMVAEWVQVSVRCKEYYNKAKGFVSTSDDSATRAVQNIEDRYGFLRRLFHETYRRRSKFLGNPLCDSDVRESLADDASKTFLNGIVEVMNNNRTHLQDLSGLAPPQPLTDRKFKEPDGRLLSQFLLSFFQPAVLGT